MHRTREGRRGAATLPQLEGEVKIESGSNGTLVSVAMPASARTIPADGTDADSLDDRD